MKHIEKWMGFYVNSKGEIDCMTWDHNPGHLNHVVKVLVPVPEEVERHFTARHKCLLLDKTGKPIEECPKEELGPLFKDYDPTEPCLKSCVWAENGRCVKWGMGDVCFAPALKVYARRDEP